MKTKTALTPISRAEIVNGTGFTRAARFYLASPEIARAINSIDSMIKAADALLEKVGMVPGIETERKALIDALRKAVD